MSNGELLPAFEELVPEEGDLRELLAANPHLQRRPKAPPEPPPPPQPRVTVLETVYHQRPGKEAKVWDCKSSFAVASGDQPWERELAVTEAETRLEGLWLARPSELFFRHDGGDGVVEIAGGMALLRPGRSCRFEPGHAHTLTLRCRSGRANVFIAATPGDS